MKICVCYYCTLFLLAVVNYRIVKSITYNIILFTVAVIMCSLWYGVVRGIMFVLVQGSLYHVSYSPSFNRLKDKRGHCNSKGGGGYFGKKFF